MGVGFGEDERGDQGIAKKRAVTEARKAALLQLRVVLVGGGRHRGGATRVSVLRSEAAAAAAAAGEEEGDIDDLFDDTNAESAVKRHRAEEQRAGFYLPPVASMPDGWGEGGT